MNNSSRFKEIYAFVVLGLTIAWAVFTVWITYRAVVTLNIANIVASSGAGILLGALVVWNGNINQFYFRKKPKK